MKFTNIAGGPRGLNTKTGTVLVEPGKTISDVEISDVEKASALASGWFIEGDAPKTKAQTDSDTAALKAIIAERDATIEDLTAKLAEALKDGDDDTDDERAKLKAEAKELGIEHARNATNDKIKELIAAKKAA